VDFPICAMSPGSGLTFGPTSLSIGPKTVLGPDSCSGEKNNAEKRPSCGKQQYLLPTAVKRRRQAGGTATDASSSCKWAKVIEELRPAIVALRVTCLRSFEDDHAATLLGTGFIVDHACGLILTGRRVVGVGPVRATATFDCCEELDVEVLYRDPVHDFGFFRFDPGKLRFTPCAEVKLNPAGLQVGSEIRVVGNDAGERLQILSGTISRIDRNVPETGTFYSDEHTFYAGAGTGTSGGSSGSPVVNQEGCAIALNVSGRVGTAASSFFLPLHHVAHTLELLRRSKPVPRGTCLATFIFRPFGELARIGLTRRQENEVMVAHPEATGMLVVEKTFCEQRQLRPGDVLMRLEGDVCVNFVEMEAVFDTHVGKSVQVVVCRDGRELRLEVPVADLHMRIPRSLLELGVDMLHDFGYHAAKEAHLPLDSGVYLARAGFVFESAGCSRTSLISMVGKVKTPTLEAFAKALVNLPDRQYFPVSWYELSEIHQDRHVKTGFAKMMRAWSPVRLWHCQGGVGGRAEHWVATELPSTAGASSLVPAPILSCASLTSANKLMRQLQPSLVMVRFRTDRRFCMGAGYEGFAEGVGVVVNAERGLILTDRHSAPQSLGDIEVTLAGGSAATIDGHVVFVHPLHNLALVSCDAAAYAAQRKLKVPVREAKFATGTESRLRPGQQLHFVGFDSQGNSFCAPVTVASVYLPSGPDEFPFAEVPRFREKNLEVLVLADTPEDAHSGVLCDSSGKIRALFALFEWTGPNREETKEAFGIPTAVFAPMIESMRKHPKQRLQMPSLDVEVTAVDAAMLLRGAAGRFPDAWLQEVGRRCGSQGQVTRAMQIHRVLPMGASDGYLQPGDVMLSVAGRTISSGLDIEEALPKCAATRHDHARGKSTKGSRVAIRVFREGKEVTVEVKPSQLSSDDDTRLLIWAGLIIRQTPRCIVESCGDHIARLASGVFVQNVLTGSPSDARDLVPQCFVLEINGQPVQKLDDMRDALGKHASLVTSQHEQGTVETSWVRLRVMDRCGQEHIYAIQDDPLFWPTLDLRRGTDGDWTHCA